MPPTVEVVGLTEVVVVVGFTGVVVVVGLTDTELDLETGGGLPPTAGQIGAPGAV